MDKVGNVKRVLERSTRVKDPQESENDNFGSGENFWRKRGNAKEHVQVI